MLNGRHFLLLGIIACAGLLSVHDGQKQIELCYKIGALEKDLRTVRDEIQLNKIKHRALQSPRAVTERAAELQLKVAPVAMCKVIDEAPPRAAEAPHSLGTAQSSHRPLAPVIPQAPPRHR